MKKITIFCAVLLIFAAFLGSCAPQGMFGNEKTFDDEKFMITLHDKLQEERATLGFYTSYLAPNDGYGVIVYRDAFSDRLGLEDLPLDDYFNQKEPTTEGTETVAKSNGELKYWESTSETTYTNLYCFKGTDGFYRFRFFCSPLMAEEMQPYFNTWAQTIVIK